MSNNIKKVLLIGAGYMAKEYAKVLRGMDIPFSVIANHKPNADLMRNDFEVNVYEGGLEAFLSSHGDCDYDYAINATNVESLGNITKLLLNAGIKNILVEKPGFTSRTEAENIQTMAKDKNVYIAYNRRFYESVKKGQEIIKADGGPVTLTFEFTEWKEVFDEQDNKSILPILFLANSTHVVDLAFFLAGGMPKVITNYISGENEIDWHKMSATYAGAGVTDNGVLFSYHANWNAVGRWGVEITTRKHRLIYRPLEKLQLVDRRSVKVYDAEIDYGIDEKYKPGLFAEVECFLQDNKTKRLCTLTDQIKKLELYEKISGEKYL